MGAREAAPERVATQLEMRLQPDHPVDVVAAQNRTDRHGRCRPLIAALLPVAQVLEEEMRQARWDR